VKHRFTILALIGFGAVQIAGAGEALNLEDQETRVNYSLGYQIGGDFKRQKLKMNPEALVQGIEDALAEAQPKISAQEMRAILIELKRKVVAEKESRSNSRMLTRLDEGKAFLEENKSKEGVVTTASGLQYLVVEPGTGKTPGPTDQVTVDYRGTRIDGKEFDSSFKRGKPATFKLNAVIKGWTEGLQLMKEGGKIKLFIPPNLAYGRRGPLAHETLIFDVELITVGEQAAEKNSVAVKDGDEAKTSEK